MVLPASHKVSRAPWYSGSVAFDLHLSSTGLSPSAAGLSRPFRLDYLLLNTLSSTPTSEEIGLGSSPFARRYLGNHFYFLLLQVLRCFSSLSLASYRLCIHLWMTAHYNSRVSPFGYLRINTCLQFPVAFRSLPRPSSPPSAKASALCS